MRTGLLGIALAAGLVATTALRLLLRKMGTSSAQHSISYVLRNNKGVEVHVTPLGAIITRLLVPDRHGDLSDVVLGYDDTSRYLVSL